MPDTKLKVVYLLGAGASQAEIDLVNPEIKTLMVDIKPAMADKIEKKNIKILLDLKNEVMDPHIDIEQLITLYELSGNYNHTQISNNLKKLFREELQKRMRQSGLGSSSKLLTALIDMHTLEGFNEELCGIITINYDNIADYAFKKVYGGVNYSIEIVPEDKRFNIETSAPPLIKLHGSFNWKNEYPISIVPKKELSKERDILWIPPGVEKDKNSYPFNILWGKARELLNCDILRVVGCSLSRNDWSLISLLYATKKLHSKGKGYSIDVINFPKSYDDIHDNYKYLRPMRGINDIPEVRAYITDLYGYKGDASTIDTEINAVLDNMDKTNIFDMWLQVQVDKLKKEGVSLKTKKGYIKRYYDLKISS